MRKLAALAGLAGLALAIGPISPARATEYHGCNANSFIQFQFAPAPSLVSDSSAKCRVVYPDVPGLSVGGRGFPAEVNVLPPGATHMRGVKRTDPTFTNGDTPSVGSTWNYELRADSSTLESRTATEKSNTNVGANPGAGVVETRTVAIPPSATSVTVKFNKGPHNYTLVYGTPYVWAPAPPS